MRRTQRGSVFVVALAVLAGLVAVLAASAATQRSRFQSETARLESDRARWAAEAAIQRSIAELELIEEGQAATLLDAWAELGRTGEEEFLLDGASFRVQIVDANSKIDLNAVTAEQLQRMPLTQEQIDSLLDWRESGQTPRPEGAKDEFYNNLPRAYNTGLRRLDSFDQLLSVRGFTMASLYEPQTDVVSTATIVQGAVDEQPTLSDLATVDTQAPQLSPTGQNKLNVNADGVTPNSLVQRGISTQLAAQIFQRRPFTRLGDVVALAGADRQAQRAIIDEFTVSAQNVVTGKLNLNTVDEVVLNTVPALTPDLVQALLSRQVQGFQNLSDILDVPGMTGQTLTNSIDFFTAQSTTFWVRVEGRSGPVRVYREALVRVDADGARILRVESPPFRSMPERWGWSEETTIQTDLTEGLL